MKKDKIQIVILSRDRPEYIKESLDSALAQKNSDIEVSVVVSDNSEKDEVNRLIERHYGGSNIQYIRRNPTVPAKEHLRLVVSECKEKYIVVFHDDDIMKPNYAKVMSSFLPKGEIVAVGCNALAFEGDTSNTKYKLHNFTFVKEYKESKEFLSRYLPGKHGIAPFAGHIYNTKILQKIPIDTLMGGKHADVVMMDSLLEYGSILWLPDILMYCRNHDSNDSGVENIPDQISLLNYMKKERELSDLIAFMRYNIWRRWLLNQSIKSLLLWKNRIVLKFLLFKSFYFLHKSFFWKALFTRIVK